MEFEKKFKEELHKREIKPSEGSWDRLRERLDEDSQPKKRNFGWLWKVAAVAILFFGLGTLIENPFEASQVVLETPEKTLQQENKNSSEVVVSEEDSEEKETEKSAFSEGIIAEKEVIPELDLPQQQPLVKTEIAAAEPELQAEPDAKDPVEESTSAASIKVSNAEVDVLLAMARENLAEDSVGYASSVPRAEELLKEVEFELEESFRRKVFEVLKEGYSRAKTAVASRSY